MSDGKVVFLAYANPKLESGSIKRLGCRNCRNKTFTVTYDGGEFPNLKCACCGADCGRIGFAPTEEP